MNTNILIAGVGGQGQVLASRILGAAAINEGKHVRTAETIGMSQRGGSVTSNVRIGDKYLSAQVPDNSCDILMGFEICETVRNINKLKPDGAVLLNTQTINPVCVSLGTASYDSEKMIDFINSKAKRVVKIDALKIAESAGSAKSCNVVMLGAAIGAGLLPFEKERFLEVLLDNIPQKFKNLNARAFELGYAATKDLEANYD